MMKRRDILSPSPDLHDYRFCFGFLFDFCDLFIGQIPVFEPEIQPAIKMLHHDDPLPSYSQRKVFQNGYPTSPLHDIPLIDRPKTLPVERAWTKSLKTAQNKAALAALGASLHLNSKQKEIKELAARIEPALKR
jgi:hypothetical protein